MKKLLLLSLVAISQLSVGQVGIGTTAPQAQLDISATSAAAPNNRDGVLVPRISAFPVANPAAAQNGMLVFLTTISGTNQPGFYYWNNPTTTWIGLGASNKSWDTTGNPTSISGTNFVGTTNAQDLDFRTNNIIKMRLSTKGQLELLNTGNSVFVGEQAGENDDLTANQNAFVGYQSGFTNTTGYGNSAVGYQSLKNNSTGYSNSAFGFGALQSNTVGTNNTAGGWNALGNLTTGVYNTAFGSSALMNTATTLANTAVGMNSLRNNNGNNNTALGAHSLQANVNGYGNLANGSSTLLSNTDGYYNTACGFTALMGNLTGYNNTATGTSALYTNATGNNNTATGVSALLGNIAGGNNTATGAYALRDNTSGGNNTATGRYALLKNGIGNNNTTSGVNSLSANTAGDNNTASGFSAMVTNDTGSNNTATGYSSMYFNISGTNNTAIGSGAMINNTQGNFNTAVGNNAMVLNGIGNNDTAIGNGSNTSLATLSNATAIGNTAVVNATSKVRIGNGGVTVIEGQVAWSNPSDARFKSDVADKVPGLDFIMKLRPVTYHFNTKKFDEHLMSQMPDSIRRKNVESTDYSKSEAIIHSGFLAQDIEKAAKAINYDFDGLHIPDASNPTDNYSVAYSQFVMPLVKSVQEQQAQIEKLKAENEALKKESANQSVLLEALGKRLSVLEKN